jgi:hypothetical protein
MESLFRPRNPITIEQALQHLYVVPVCPRQNDGQQQATSVGQEVALGSAFPSVPG